MSTSKRHVSLEALQNTNWQSIFDNEKEKKSLTFCENHCFELALTHRDLRPMPSVDLEDQGRVWDSSAMIPYYFDVEMMNQELVRLSAGASSTTMIPFTQVGGIGGSSSARIAVENEWIQIILLPTDWLFGERRELEVRWIVGNEKRIKNRFRRSDTSRQLLGQIPADYWGCPRFTSSKTICTVSNPLPLKIIRYEAEAHTQDEHGVAANSVTVMGVVAQLENGIVLWWHQLYPAMFNDEISLQGECLKIGDTLINVATGLK